MANKAALITGGARRIGRALALALAREGYDIALHYRSSGDAAVSLCEEIGALGRRSLLFQWDLTETAGLSDLVDRVFEAFPGCNVLIHNASVFERARMMETTPACFERAFRVHLAAPFFLSQAFARRCTSGQIITLLDTKISKTQTTYFVYTLTKKALADFTQMAARELAPRIRVNGVAPGLILPSSGSTDEAFRRMGEKVPLCQTGHPEDVVRAVLFLLEHPYITGTCLYVDGGEHLL